MKSPEKELVLQRFIDFCQQKDDWEVAPPPGLFNVTPDDLVITDLIGDGSFDIGIAGPGFRTDGPNMKYYKHDFGNPENYGWSLGPGGEISSDAELNALTTPGVYKVSMPDYPPGTPRDDVLVVVYELDDNTPEEAILALVNEKFTYALPVPTEITEDMGIRTVVWDEYHPEMYSVFGTIYAKDVDVLVEGFIDAPEV